MRAARGTVLLALATLFAFGGSFGHEAAVAADQTPVASEKPVSGDTFVQASIGDITGLIPNITTDAPSHAVGNLIYDGLVQTDKDLNWVSSMAESWQFSKDCLNLTFKLRKNVKWHDGKPFTAEDVHFTYKTMMNPKTPTAYRDDFELVRDIQVLDPYTVRVIYSQPYAKAVGSWGTAMLPKHLLAKYVEEGKLREAPQNTQPVGTGPYRFQEWKSGEKVVVVANKDYYVEGRPYLGRIVYRVIPSQATIFLELKAKGVDMADLTAIQYARQTEYPAFKQDYNKFRYPGSGYTYFGFNLKDPRFADRRVRQAFAHAINKPELIEGVVMGLAREATGPLRPGTWAYTDKVKRYPYDPAKAKQLLSAAGWSDRNGDGILRNKEGQPFSFTIRTNQGNEERKKVAELIQQWLKEIGIQTDIQTIEWAAFLKEYIKQKRFEAIILGWGTGIDPDQYPIWHSSQMGPDQLNQISFSNAEVDALLEKGRTSCHQQERVATYRRIQEILAEEQPLIFLYFKDALPAVSSRVRGIKPEPAGIGYNFIDWFVPKQLQRYTSG
ncbi:MAG: peptide-binding protein [Candidatus Rokubacteria bacterium]|nr:peptide-binding protein [Candidatus Rokubacteria bacterium]